ncbi:hypothetical protein FZZ91_00640 [Synechococcus sp. HB1133]|uniref:hypothetical protein n=1 Tax=unclassified Synechococcus TaxID=2626047 RepID=UPI001408C7E8|nr:MULTISPECIES: hypothetical protein [unclassified Synechococcus]MCB4393864.1 hypothetical protein [Synechococcus sp. PH41509]MCB4421344.1 hypothetical protein [Synechococcus sp. HB1133]MCB4431305.1 hypothetical protein [Synechococcus sp. HBA1120]NHI80286.1 hypothetical protein [Synechococcus sp. HB1133]
MRILVSTSNLEWANSAGARIRYKRLIPYFEIDTVQLIIIPTSHITAQLIKKSDIVIIAKDYSLNSIKLISYCQSKEIKIGLDLFDDYFSDRNISSLIYLQNWLDVASKMVNFIICSTTRMEQISHQFIRSDLVHKISDTRKPNILIDETNHLLNEKIDAYKHNGQINILWFGIGDNPIFDVGLVDLSTYSNALFKLRSSFEYPRLTILTNERALTAKSLTSISNLPIEVNLEIWTEETEDALLRETNIAFLPVSHQKFSIAKSTNRCLTALTYGCQVLSNGFDLYSEFSEFIYKTTDDLVKDFQSKKFKFNSNSLVDFDELCDSRYSPKVEATSFINFINTNLINSNPIDLLRIVVIDFQDKQDSLDTHFSRNQFPTAHGDHLARLQSCNFGIEKYESQIYLEFTDDCHRFVLERWSPYLEQFIFDGCEVYRLPLRIIEDIEPHILPHIKNILAYRYRRRASNPARDNIKRRVLFSYISDSLQLVLDAIFGQVYIYLSKYPHPYKVVG